MDLNWSDLLINAEFRSCLTPSSITPRFWHVIKPVRQLTSDSATLCIAPRWMGLSDHTLLGPWVWRFLLDHLVAERNLTRNTQCSYRDALSLLIPFIAEPPKRWRD